jgi:hypothetical protein
MRFFFLSILFFHFILRFFLLVGQVIFGLAKLIGSCQDNSHTIYFIFFFIFSLPSNTVPILFFLMCTCCKE